MRGRVGECEGMRVREKEGRWVEQGSRRERATDEMDRTSPVLTGKAIQERKAAARWQGTEHCRPAVVWPSSD